jgi:hypothetical protein
LGGLPSGAVRSPSVTSAEVLSFPEAGPVGVNSADTVRNIAACPVSSAAGAISSQREIAAATSAST